MEIFYIEKLRKDGKSHFYANLERNEYWDKLKKGHLRRRKREWRRRLRSFFKEIVFCYFQGSVASAARALDSTRVQDIRESNVRRNLGVVRFKSIGAILESEIWIPKADGDFCSFILLTKFICPCLSMEFKVTAWLLFDVTFRSPSSLKPSAEEVHFCLFY